MAKQQKGWVDAKTARERAARAHRSNAIRQARKGKADAPEYRETTSGGCLFTLALVALAWLIGRVLMAGRWPRA